MIFATLAVLLIAAASIGVDAWPWGNKGPKADIVWFVPKEIRAREEFRAYFAFKGDNPFLAYKTDEEFKEQISFALQRKLWFSKKLNESKSEESFDVGNYVLERIDKGKLKSNITPEDYAMINFDELKKSEVVYRLRVKIPNSLRYLLGRKVKLIIHRGKRSVFRHKLGLPSPPMLLTRQKGFKNWWRDLRDKVKGSKSEFDRSKACFKNCKKEAKSTKTEFRNWRGVKPKGGKESATVTPSVIDMSKKK